MKKLSLVSLAFLATTMLTVVLLTGSVIGQVKKGATRPLTTKQMMAGLVGSNCKALGKGIKAGPADDKAWDSLAQNAALLNEASHVLMADGRCPDADWANASTMLREQSQEVLNCIDARDAEATQAAFGALTKSCGVCHSKHKK
jgi:hypothetical protein